MLSTSDCLVVSAFVVTVAAEENQQPDDFKHTNQLGKLRSKGTRRTSRGANISN
jgi:hypothetical protein